MRTTAEKPGVCTLCCAWLWGLCAFLALAMPAAGQTQLIAGDVLGAPGTTVDVPITLEVPVGMQVETLQFNLTVSPTDDAPAIETQVVFTADPGVNAPDFNIANNEQTVLVGWLLSDVCPSGPCIETVSLGTLAVPIPAGAAAGDSYTVDVINPSATSDGSTDVSVEDVDGSITIPACLLDVDGSGPPVDIATDVVYLSRHLLGLAPVPSSFRDGDPSIPSDETIAANIDLLGISIDVDADGEVVVATDVVYIARRLLGLAAVPSSFRDADPTIPPDDEIEPRVDALCP